jgi:hypothetical protein
MTWCSLWEWRSFRRQCSRRCTLATWTSRGRGTAEPPTSGLRLPTRGGPASSGGRSMAMRVAPGSRNAFERLTRKAEQTGAAVSEGGGAEAPARTWRPRPWARGWPGGPRWMRRASRWKPASISPRAIHDSRPLSLLFTRSGATAEGPSHGLEVRPPFLHGALVDQAFSLPSSLKLRRGRSKCLLKQACRFSPPLTPPRLSFSTPLTPRGGGPEVRFPPRESVRPVRHQVGLSDCEYGVFTWG